MQATGLAVAANFFLWSERSFRKKKIFLLEFLFYYFNMLVPKINFRNKKYYLMYFASKKHFKKQ
jgi:hypothetical protein